MEIVKIKAKDELMLETAVFEPESNSLKPYNGTAVQIIHGAAEHKGRYYDLAEFLKSYGFAVIVSDMRGHGFSTNDKYPYGFMDGVEELVDDQAIITNYIKKRYAGAEIVLFGHSLGSMIARCYLQKYDNEITKLILSGTVGYIKPVRVGVAVTKAASAISGKYTCNGFTKFFNGSNADDSWICSVPEVIEAVRNDPLCQKKYNNSALLTICEANRQLHCFKKYKCQNKELKILSITGSEDPVTGKENGLKDTIDTLLKIGYSNITNIVYEGMKHEVINEYGKEKVYEDILKFLEIT